MIFSHCRNVKLGYMIAYAFVLVLNQAICWICMSCLDVINKGANATTNKLNKFSVINYYNTIGPYHNTAHKDYHCCQTSIKLCTVLFFCATFVLRLSVIGLTCDPSLFFLVFISYVS